MDKLPVCLRTHLRIVCFSEEMSAVWEWWGGKPALLNFFILKSIYCAVRKDMLCVFCTPAIQHRLGIIQRTYENFVYIWSTRLMSINPGLLGHWHGLCQTQTSQGPTGVSLCEVWMFVLYLHVPYHNRIACIGLKSFLLLIRTLAWSSI